MLFISLPSWSMDAVHTRKNGTLEGKILEQDTASIRIELKGGSVIRLPRSEILRIQYGKAEPVRVPYFSQKNSPKSRRWFIGGGVRTDFGFLGFAYTQKIWNRLYGKGAVGVGPYDYFVLSLGADMVWRNDKRWRPFAGVAFSGVRGEKVNFGDSSWIAAEPGLFGAARVGFQFLLTQKFGIYLSNGLRLALYGGEVEATVLEDFGPFFGGGLLMSAFIFAGSGYASTSGIFWEF